MKLFDRAIMDLLSWEQITQVGLTNLGALYSWKTKAQSENGLWVEEGEKKRLEVQASELEAKSL